MSNERSALSAATAKRIDWVRVSRSLSEHGFAPDRGGPEDGELPPDYNERVRLAFDAAVQELALAAAPLKRQTAAMLWIIFPALGVAAASGALLAVLRYSVFGGLLTGGSLTALFALMAQAWRLGRDQFLLESLPTSYRIMFDLAKDKAQNDLVFQAFLKEMVSLRANLGR